MAHRRRPWRSPGLAIAAGLLLAGCSNPWLPGRGIYQIGASEPPATVEKHCYHTLAEVTCYPQPLPDAETRRVGWADVAPTPPAAEPGSGR